MPLELFAPDLHITRAGVLRAGLRAHQEHAVDQDAQAADRNNVPAAVLQVVPHEADTGSDQDVSITEQCERMQTACTEVGRDYPLGIDEAYIGADSTGVERTYPAVASCLAKEWLPSSGRFSDIPHL